MSLESREQESFGTITSGIDKGGLVLKTIDFVHRQLPKWRDDPDRPDERSEPMLNPQLCSFLDRRARDDFPMVQFSHEEPQGGHRTIDISARAIKSMTYSAYEACIVLECKRLPSPSADREKEYVTGGKKKSGGIQRFRLGLHAASLQVVGMIGYVQKESAQHWHGKINRWISQLSKTTTDDGCTWSDRDKLGILEVDTLRRTANSRSDHIRTGKSATSDLTIHHLWVVMHPPPRRRSQK